MPFFSIDPLPPRDFFFFPSSVPSEPSFFLFSVLFFPGMALKKHLISQDFSENKYTVGVYCNYLGVGVL